MPHQWDPGQYEKFEKERNQPFYDLLQLLHPLHHPRILDLGCGNGSLTKFLHEKFHASYTLGIDSSKEMLVKARLFEEEHLFFEEKKIETFHSERPFDLIISNAAIQWLPEHAVLFKQLTHLLAPGGQMAIQMPANENKITHTIAVELAKEEPYKQAIQHPFPFHHLLSMEEYALLLEKLGFENQAIRLQLYTHFLDSTASVVEWMKGGLLTYYKSFLSQELYSKFLEEYRKRLLEQLGWSEPFFFSMKCLFLWGQMPWH